jgi:hypothetical protein
LKGLPGILSIIRKLLIDRDDSISEKYKENFDVSSGSYTHLTHTQKVEVQSELPLSVSAVFE